MASALHTYTVRPLSKPARADLKDAFRIFLSPSALLFLKLKAGDACSIWKESSPQQQRRTAIAWPAPEKLQEHVVQTSKPLQKAYQLNLGDKVHIQKADKGIDAIGTILLEEVEAAHNTKDNNHHHHPHPHPQHLPLYALSRREKDHWAWLLEDPLGLGPNVPRPIFYYITRD
jgi:AAA family ATPase